LKQNRESKSKYETLLSLTHFLGKRIFKETSHESTKQETSHESTKQQA
jgi:hypothetical protein